MNIFNQYPEFISRDVRTERRDCEQYGPYNINADFQYQRHLAMMPPTELAGKRVLDLGCCIGGTGAWALHHGASRYVGVELQRSFCDIAKDNLSKYFAQGLWEIRCESFTDFFANNKEQFDIVVAFGILYQNIYFETLLKQLANLNADTILLDSVKPNLPDFPAVEYKKFYMVHEEGNQLEIEAALPNLKAVQVVLGASGYKLTNDSTLEKLFPKQNRARFFGTFKKVSDGPYTAGFEERYVEPTSIMPFNQGKTEWVFDSTVADSFATHARQHIPDYDRVINLSVEVCQRLIADPVNDPIVDVGSAIGETVKRLYGAGFRNLVGVDSSADMLNKTVDLPIAHWVHSASFPSQLGPYGAVLCNWTLHFMQDKEKYLGEIYQNMRSGGCLILTDKTCNQGLELELYHNFKRKQGLSKEAIRAKAESLVGQMFVDNPEWYINTLRDVGYTTVSIINFTPCFTTFLARKP